MGLYLRVSVCRDLEKARAHVKYIAFRSRESQLEERGAFDRSRDHADVKPFMERLDDHVTRHPMANKAYKITISLSEQEFRERGLTSWKPVVREAMASLEQKWGVRLEWIASEHRANGHPHVHVVMKASHVDELGRARQFRLDPERLRDFKREVGRVIDRDRPRAEERRPRSRDVLFHEFGRLLAQWARSSSQESEERDREHFAWLRKQERERDDDRGR